MTGTKTAPDPTEKTLPPHEAGREVLSYVEKEEAEADALFNEVHGVDKEKAAEAEGAKADKEPEAEKDSEGKPLVEVFKEEEKEAEPDDLTKGLNTGNADLRIKAAQTKMHESNKRANSITGERDRLQEENEALQKKLEAREAAPPAEPGKEAEKEETPKTDELTTAMEELNQEYPEIAKPMLKMMARQEVENKKLTEQLSVLQEKDVERDKTAKETVENAHIKAISEAHSDFEEISEEPLLDEWIDGLPAIEKAGAQAIRKSGSTGDVIALLTSFKKANGYEIPAEPSAESSNDGSQKKSSSKLDKARSKSNPSFNKTKDVNLKDAMVGKFTAKQIGAMDMEEYKAREPEIDEWMQAGAPE